MNATVEFAGRALVIGVGATLTMDVWAAVLRRFGVPSLNFSYLGRWLGHLPARRFFHESIAKSPPVRGEAVLGWCAHYSIGVAFAALLLAVFSLDWARSPTLAPALLVGIVTVVAPLFLLQPALGAGIASSNTPSPLFNSMKSLVTHVVFGFGLFLSARAIVSLERVLP
jgi:tetrahydromethanopterin S-methyltransferase subunit E